MSARRGNTRGRRALLAALLAALAGASAAEPPPPAPATPAPPTSPGPPPEEDPTPKVVDIGQQRYRVGAIEVDKAKERFRVPARLREREAPLEFLAVARRGAKGYESLLEVEASAFEFNLACLLIGLDAKAGKPSRHHFDAEAAEGDPVRLWVEWTAQGAPVRKRLADLLLLDGKPVEADDWVYVGSSFGDDGRFRAAVDGTLLGFVHDPASVIEHRSGLGLGRWGAVRANTAALPASDLAIQVLVERVRR